MLRRRCALTVIGSLVALLVPIAAASAASTPGPRLDLPQDQSLLFALQSSSGTLIPTKAAHGRFVLTLRGVPSQLLWFTDSPARSAGAISTRNFVRRWGLLGFGGLPPDAVIRLRRGPQNANALAVKLRTPRYNAAKHTLTVHVRALRKVDSDLARLGRRLARRLPRRFGNASLFIEGGGAPKPGLGSSGAACPSVGELDTYPASVTPQGYLAAAGQTVSISNYVVLTSALDFRFGGSPSSGELGIPAVAAPAGFSDQLCNDGVYPSQSTGEYSGGGQCAAGALNLQATWFQPSGWVPADGRMLNAGLAPALYKAIGTSFGGNGQTFAVPNLSAPPGLTWDICVNGTGWTTQSSPGCTVSELTPFASPDLPADYLPASGRVAPIASYPALYSLIGTDFGGNGISNFQLPNVAGPAGGVQYGICWSGTWPGD